ncbi:MAG TPA: DUF885 domain-containing protein [Candidatus Krumholzibacteria bacterium]|nr:DUF885 domain-containing protein [Candidatus Krumholzibacteria bacterium]
MQWVLATAFLAAVSGSAVAKTPAEDFQQIVDDEWEARMQASPLFATQVGDHRFDDRLPSVSIADQLEHEKQDRAFLARLDAIDRGKLADIQRVNYDIFHRILSDRIEEYEFKTYLMPITNREGFHTSFAQLADRVPLRTTQDYENYCARLEAFKAYAGQYIDVMRAGIKGGYVLPKIVLDGWEAAVDPHVVDDPTQSLLYKPFASFPETVAEKDRARLTARGRKAITESVVPGYRAFRDFMAKEYVPACRESIGASDLPNGKAYYEHCVRYYTTLDLTPKQVHETGLAEVKRIRAEMDQVIAETGFKGTFPEFLEFLRTDKQFYVDTPEQLMKEAALICKKMDGQLPTLFKTLPRMSYGLKQVPDFMADKTSTAYYEDPTGDGTRAGFYYVNTSHLDARPLYELEALSLHEAVPGHHLQVAIMYELQDVPNFRRYDWFTAFVEGWGLYSERLGLEVGFYQDPYSNFGRLTYEMWRAMRLVVDTGMHYFGWTRQQAIDYMAANGALSMHNVTTEVDRYISWPGQALAYKTGELKFRELRAYATRELGDKFDVREFHDICLWNGGVPLQVLDANVKAWVEKKKQE